MLIASRLMATSLDQFDTKVGFTYCKSAGEQYLSATVTRTPNMNKQAIVRKILSLLTLWVLVIQSNNINGGGGGIRTHEPNTRLTVFKTAAFNRSATPPQENSFQSLVLKQENSCGWTLLQVWLYRFQIDFQVWYDYTVY